MLVTRLFQHVLFSYLSRTCILSDVMLCPQHVSVMLIFMYFMAVSWQLPLVL